MSVEFNEYSFKKSHKERTKATGFGKIVMKLSGGKIKTQAQANKVMLVLSLAIISLSVYLFYTQL